MHWEIFVLTNLWHPELLTFFLTFQVSSLKDEGTGAAVAVRAALVSAGPDSHRTQPPLPSFALSLVGRAASQLL